MKTRLAISILAALTGLAGIWPVSAQLQLESWIPVGPPLWTNFTFQTAGGITYFVHTEYVQICHRVDAGSVGRTGTNLYQTINYEQESGDCVLCECGGDQTHVSVLGALPPGDYSFQIVSWNPQVGRDMLYTNLLFHVAATWPPVLGWMPPTNGPVPPIAICGISNVQYVIECSTTLTNWTPVVTNTGPYIWTPPAGSPTNCFYRTLIIGE
jgi:hypothetical protein